MIFLLSIWVLESRCCTFRKKKTEKKREKNPIDENPTNLIQDIRRINLAQTDLTKINLNTRN